MSLGKTPVSGATRHLPQLLWNNFLNRRTFSNQWGLIEASSDYLDLDDWSFVRGDAKHRGFIILWGELWRLIYILYLNSDLRKAKYGFFLKATMRVHNYIYVKCMKFNFNTTAIADVGGICVSTASTSRKYHSCCSLSSCPSVKMAPSLLMENRSLCVFRL